MDTSFGKKEKLKLRAHITALFSKGKTIKSFPVHLVYLPADEEYNKVGVSVPKRHFKKAVDRNRIKRLMREAYRLNKNTLKGEQKYLMMLIYSGKKKTDFKEISRSILKILEELEKKKE